MCLSIPGKVVKIKGDKATIDYQGEKREASITLKKEVKVGDYVIVSARFVMEIIPKDEARRTIEVWNETDKP
ncbi:MAG: HypC/HybG/HupF family hydrogenase formation chaperone [Nanoarchaeota archaeon]|nr:HypC/HybG/HupF family hydrogenase formation chaperone [Nanoarchaeota archaeon]MBU1270078.1 HypC/HybG/HupF family hydrogenase formation chaperone [Nanoarchaeota archaeon]MBU1604993.1 HypC/HybG/HupF family hydrogenase formation chaperone [Nanoarchaeota archaeon]MBU2443414.1 HypC/HybG/HupF family hydrogenase formation chaperone [Nanoarchaeota archaeon]